MNVQEILEKWLMADRDTTPLWRLPINEIEYEAADDPTDGVEIAALADNIRQCGLIHPILVEKQRSGKKYRLVSGRRRIEAVALLGRTHISAMLIKSASLLPLQLSLSENFMRKAPHYLELAEQLKKLLEQMTITELSRLFSVKEEMISSYLSLNVLSAYEKRLIRLISLREEDAKELVKIENSNIRKLILEKLLESGEGVDRSAMIAQAIGSPNFRLTQTEKIYVKDIRIFVNTVERAIEMMRTAGYTANLERIENDSTYRFTITVEKQANSSSSSRLTKIIDASAKNVSRETSADCRNAENVSRETSENSCAAIDEAVKT